MILESVWIDDVLLHDCAESPAVGLTAANLGSGAEPRVSSSSKPSADGAINRTRYWSSRMIELVGYCGRVGGTAQEANELLAALRAAFTLREPHTLRYTPVGLPERQLSVVVNSAFEAPVEGLPPVLQWSISLEAPDPRVYLSGLISHSYEPGSSSAVTLGLELPLNFPLEFSFASTPGGDEVLSANNPGSSPTPVLLTAVGPVTSLSGILNRTTGERVAFNLTTLDDGEVLEVNTETKTVLDDGVPAPELIDAAANTWIELVPGENILVLEGAGFVPGETSLTATYRAAVL